MQDRFVGDVGDFGKYGLLRALTGIWPRVEPLLPLGVAWYIPDDDAVESTPSGHGQKIEYLFNPKLRDHYRSGDKQLFDRLKHIVCCERRIKAVEDSGLLGDSARGEVVFHGEPMRMPAAGQRRDKRAAWFQRVHKKIKGARILFLDPDTGLADPKKERAPKQLSFGSKDASKYAFVCELEALMDLGRTVVWYQSFDRRGDHESQAREWSRRLGQALALDDRQLHIMEYGSRAFAILPGDEDEETVVKRLTALVETASPWKPLSSTLRGLATSAQE